MHLITSYTPLAITFLTQKKANNYKNFLKLRIKGKITALGPLFAAADEKEIFNLIARGVFRFEAYDDKVYGFIRLFKLRLIREIKGRNIIPYKKSRLII